ncbi:type II secretion system protein N [Saliniradius amylolyticus]|uniref:type II secretion system protein N n=1 Tax=Saliniradius amylolyticus TaxID=2183582 RepID=UPI0013A5B134|nr:type II secretion system protein N [Saliniradius amylolyticus]
MASSVFADSDWGLADMWPRVRFSLVLLLTYVIFLLVQLPANQVLPRLALPKGVEFSGASGTLWQGKLGQLVLQGFPVDEVHWQLNPWPLLLGQIALELDAGDLRDADALALKGQINLSSDEIQAEDLQLYLPTAPVIARLPLPLPVKAGGRFKLAIDNLAIADRQCQRLQGQGQWLNASVAGTQGPIALGQFDAQLTCSEGTLEIQVQEPNSFGLSATAIVPANFKIRVQGRFKPDASLPQEVHDAARFFGQPDAQGYYRVKL